MKINLETILLLATINTATAIICRRSLGKCSQNSDCCNNRRCMNWGRCSLFYRVQSEAPNTVYKCFDNNTELRDGVNKYREGNKNEKSLVKEIYGNPIGMWCVDNVTDFDSVFSAWSRSDGFNEDISRWNTSSATKMESMFTLQTYFNQDISRWDVSKVTNIAFMFSNAKSFNQDISRWNVSKVTDFKNVFILAIDFNQDISKWDVSRAYDMSGMFYEANFFNQNLCKWGSKIRTQILGSMFTYTECPNNGDPVFDSEKNIITNICHNCV
jgi:surface protein